MNAAQNCSDYFLWKEQFLMISTSEKAVHLHLSNSHPTKKPPSSQPSQNSTFAKKSIKTIKINGWKKGINQTKEASFNVTNFQMLSFKF